MESSLGMKLQQLYSDCMNEEVAMGGGSGLEREWLVMETSKMETESKGATRKDSA